MREEITAEWARKTANIVLGERVKKQINDCLDAIQNAVKKNQMSCSIAIYVEDLTIRELQDRGFKVTKHEGYDQRDGDYINVSW